MVVTSMSWISVTCGSIAYGVEGKFVVGMHSVYPLSLIHRHVAFSANAKLLSCQEQLGVM